MSLVQGLMSPTGTDGWNIDIERWFAVVEICRSE
jgi:hypothetical protein